MLFPFVFVLAFMGAGRSSARGAPAILLSLSGVSKVTGPTSMLDGTSRHSLNTGYPQNVAHKGPSGIRRRDSPLA